MRPTLEDLEEHTNLGPTQAARLLGMAYVSYAQIRAGSHGLKEYHVRHIELILALPKKELDALKEKYVFSVLKRR